MHAFSAGMDLAVLREAFDTLRKKKRPKCVFVVFYASRRAASPTFFASLKPSFSMLRTKPSSPPTDSLSNRLRTSAIYS